MAHHSNTIVSALVLEYDTAVRVAKENDETSKMLVAHDSFLERVLLALKTAHGPHQRWPSNTPHHPMQTAIHKDEDEFNVDENSSNTTRDGGAVDRGDGDDDDDDISQWEARIPNQLWSLLLREESTPSSLSSSSSSSPLGEAVEEQTIMASTTEPLLQGTTMTNERSDEWLVGLPLVARLARQLAPTELYTTVWASVALGSDDTDSETNSSVTTTTNTTALPLTGLILSCWALQHCSTSRAPNLHRRNRWQSMMFELLALFQRLACSSDTNVPIWALDVWCTYVLPSVATVQSARGLSLTSSSSSSPPSSSSHQQDPRWMLYEAGTISCAIGLLANQTTLPPEVALVRSRRVWESLETHVLAGRFELLCEHFYGEKQHPSLLRTFGVMTEAAAMARWTLGRPNDTGDETDDDDSNRMDWEDITFGIDTHWSPMSVAMLIVETGWMARPLVWSVPYQWYLFLPNINQLLLSPDNDDMDVEHNNQTCQDKPRDSGVVSSFQALHRLVQQTPSCLLSKRSCWGWSSFIGLLQLLSNHMIATTMAESQSGNSPKTVAHSAMPTAVALNQLIKTIVGMFHPPDQVRIVQTLWNDSPHPGLRPKLIDILRNFVTWKNPTFEEHVWGLVDDLILRDFDPKLKTEMSHDYLLDKMEDYQAVLGLVELWILSKQTLPTSPHLDNLPLRIHNVLEVVTATVSRVDPTPDVGIRSFRLHLLENSLQRILAFMESLSSGSAND